MFSLCLPAIAASALALAIPSDGPPGPAIAPGFAATTADDKAYMTFAGIYDQAAPTTAPFEARFAYQGEQNAGNTSLPYFYYKEAANTSLFDFNATANPSGLVLAQADPALCEQLNLKDGGVVVVSVAPGGPAAEAGLQPNDILLLLGDGPLFKPEDLTLRLESLTDDKAPLELLRQGKRVKLEVQPRRYVILGGTQPSTPSWYIGLPVSPVDDTLRSHLALPESAGLIVTSVQDDSPASKAGFQPHDILLMIGDTALDTTETLVAQIQASEGKPIAVKVLRAGKPQTIEVTPAPRPATEASPTWARSVTQDIVPFTTRWNPIQPSGPIEFFQHAPQRWEALTFKATEAPLDTTKQLEALTKQVEALSASLAELKKAIDAGKK